jgi:hypothetical protein
VYANHIELIGPGSDQELAASRGRGQNFMKSVRPDNSDPIPMRASPHRMGTIMLRFVGLLFVAVVVLALAWR